MGYKYFLVLSSHPEMGIFSILAKISGNIEIEISRTALFYLKTRFCLKHFFNDCL